MKGKYDRIYRNMHRKKQIPILHMYKISQKILEQRKDVL